MRAARKCGPIRGMRSIGFSTRPSRRQFRNPLQNSPKLLIPLMPAVVAESVFIQVALQVFRRNRVIDAADPALHKAPESLDAVGMNVAANVNPIAVLDGPMAETQVLSASVPQESYSAITRQFIGVNDAARNDVFAHKSHKPCGSHIGNGARFAEIPQRVEPIKKAA